MSADPGLQPERTELAWRRTVLALAVGALVSVRVLPSVLGDWAIVSGVAGVLAAAGLWVAARYRSRQVEAAFRELAAAMPGGALLAATALITATGAALGLVHTIGAAVAP